MNAPSVELVYAGDCPNVGATRVQVLRAFGLAGRAPHWREWRTDDPACPQRLRRFGSPTVLIDGKDAVGGGAADAACCRIYAQADGQLMGVPSAEQIAAALSEPPSAGRPWRIAALGGPALAFALLPKLVCPVCWPAYAAAVSALGLTFLLEVRYLLPLTIGALALAVGALAWKARGRRGFGPAALALAASVAIVAGKFAADSAVILYGGATAFAAAFIWNAWPRRTLAGQGNCPACADPSAPGPSPLHGDSHAHKAKD